MSIVPNTLLALKNTYIFTFTNTNTSSTAEMNRMNLAMQSPSYSNWSRHSCAVLYFISWVFVRRRCRPKVMSALLAPRSAGRCEQQFSSPCDF